MKNLEISKLLIDVDVINESESFGNAWYRALRHVKMHGKKINFGDKSEKKIAIDTDLSINLTGNALQEAIDGKLHLQFPTKELVKLGYLEEWKRGYDWRKQGFTYCYEDRAEAYQGYKKLKETYKHIDFKSVSDPSFEVESFRTFTIDQWKLAKEDLAQQIDTQISSNRNVIVIGNPSIDRFEIPDSPPCLREIWIRFAGFIDGTPVCIAKWFFRSRDLGSAWQTNIIGILSAIRREVTIPNNCELIQAIDKNHSLHVYHWDWPLFDTVKRIETMR